MKNVKILIETAKNLKEFTEKGVNFRLLQVGEGTRKNKPVLLLKIKATQFSKEIKVNNPIIIVNPPKKKNTDKYLKSIITNVICPHM